MGACRLAGTALLSILLATAGASSPASALDLPDPFGPDPAPSDAPTPRDSPTPSDTPGDGTVTAEPMSPAAPVERHRLDRRCRTGRVVCVDKSGRRLWLVVDGDVQLTMTVRIGGAHPTREGVFSVYWKDRRHVSSLYPGLQMPYSLFFSRGEAVHYSPEFARYGYDRQPASHGCVETRDRDRTAQLFDLVHTGDKVVVYRSHHKRHRSRSRGGA